MESDRITEGSHSLSQKNYREKQSSASLNQKERERKVRLHGVRQNYRGISFIESEELQRETIICIIEPERERKESSSSWSQTELQRDLIH